MAKRRDNGKTTPLEWAIRILILIIFVASIAIAIGRLINEWYPNWKHKQELEQRQEELGEMPSQPSEENGGE